MYKKKLNECGGLEIGLIGVDGTGKTSVAEAISRLRIPVRIVHMGHKNFQTSFMRLFEKGVIGWPFGRIATNYEFLVRRLQGWRLARKGWVVIYDRHPVEHFEPDTKLFKHKVGNVLNATYSWAPDLTFYLTGDYKTIWERKKEQSAATLEEMDHRFQRILNLKRVAFQRVNVTDQDLDSVIAVITSHIARYLPDIESSKPGEQQHQR